MRKLWKILPRTCYLKDNSIRQIRDKKTAIQRNTAYAKQNCGKNKVKMVKVSRMEKNVN